MRLLSSLSFSLRLHFLLLRKNYLNIEYIFSVSETIFCSKIKSKIQLMTISIEITRKIHCKGIITRYYEKIDSSTQSIVQTIKSPYSNSMRRCYNVLLHRNTQYDLQYLITCTNPIQNKHIKRTKQKKERQYMHCQSEIHAT